jgi:hypothetical protein
LIANSKATVRRMGVYSGASGPRDFNEDLFDPISRNLATGWERAFQRRLPAILEGFAKEATVNLQQFHQAAKARAEQRHTNVAGLVTLSSQIVAHMRTIQALPATICAKITDLQREANRQFTPVICKAMTNAYTVCTNESGPGSYARMKAAMAEHVDDAAEVVQGQLQAMCRAVKQVRLSIFGRETTILWNVFWGAKIAYLAMEFLPLYVAHSQNPHTFPAHLCFDWQSKNADF